MNLPKFEQIDHTADVGLKIYGADLAELFENAAVGLFDIITNLEKVKPVVERDVEISAPDLEALLVNWLSELNYMFLTKKELYREFQVSKINEGNLSAQIKGQKLDLDRHEIYTEVKAVTYHQIYVKQTDRGWESQVIFDL